LAVAGGREVKMWTACSPTRPDGRNHLTRDNMLTRTYQATLGVRIAGDQAIRMTHLDDTPAAAPPAAEHHFAVGHGANLGPTRRRDVHPGVKA